MHTVRRLLDGLRPLPDPARQERERQTAILRVVLRLNDVALVAFVFLAVVSPTVRDRPEVALGVPLYVLLFRAVLALYLSDRMWAWGRRLRNPLLLAALSGAPAVATALCFGYAVAVTGGVHSPFLPVFVVAMVFPVSLFPDWRGLAIALVQHAVMVTACLHADLHTPLEDALFLAMLFGVPAVVVPLARNEQRYRVLSAVDALSGVMLRRRFEELAERRLARRTRRAGGVGLAMLDVDHFKAINDAVGHLHGDRALRAVGQAAREVLNPADLIGRMGGDEFAILLFRRTRREVEAELERLRRCVAELDLGRHADGAGPQRITVSIGLAWSTARQVRLLELLSAADEALYRAKERGRNRLEVAPLPAWAGRVA